MAGSTYKIVELVGTSDTSWEEAAKAAEADIFIESQKIAVWKKKDVRG